ncbi:DUF1642 domain-containing protein [Pediococcus pentosaceus]|uniref:DUF1642 domain-containing protein n=1 Tax=Pediococcus pentosaceus TaxID=1255 RepID=UPI00200DDEAC|nr:DUF1642 domain-containing protein [Pediococcus pentosaceus]UQB01187.1 DUF1642 domain-containing protein [Pediococcus pentosaceus]UQB03035.1 DUF1642 domain-containing protein [Pediococcus pentosaceus]
MTKDEYLKTLQKEEDDNAQEAEDNGYGSGYYDGLDYAVGLVGKLDEPKKVVIPQFVADWIEKEKVYYSDEVDPMIIAYWIGNHVGSSESHYEWMKNIYNQKLLLNAIANGYEVEKEKKYRVKLPGMIGDNGQQYISKSMDDKLFACAYRDYLEQEFTKEELEKFPDWIQQLEFEEVEDE